MSADHPNIYGDDGRSDACAANAAAAASLCFACQGGPIERAIAER
jgi:hypothetical protein